MIADKGNPLDTLHNNSDHHKHHHHQHHHTQSDGHTGGGGGGGLLSQESSTYSHHHEPALPFENSIQTSSSISVDMLPFPAAGGTDMMTLLYYMFIYNLIVSLSS